MLTTDCHAHCFSGTEFPDEFFTARAASIRARRPTDRSEEDLVTRMRTNMTDGQGDLLRADLEAAGFTRAVVVGLDWGLLGPDVPATHPRRQLAWAAELVGRHDGFFRFVLGLDPRRPEAGDLARQAATHPWVVGYKLYPPAGFLPTDPACDAVYRAAVDTGRFVMAHTGRQSYPFDLDCGRVERYGAVQRRHPDLTLVLAHSGYPFWGAEAIEVAAGHPGTVLDVSAWDRLLGVDDERLDHFLEQAFQALGPGRVLFGSDHSSGARSRDKVPALQRWKARFEEVARANGVTDHDLEAATRTLLGEGP